MLNKALLQLFYQLIHALSAHRTLDVALFIVICLANGILELLSILVSFEHVQTQHLQNFVFYAHQLILVSVLKEILLVLYQCRDLGLQCVLLNFLISHILIGIAVV